MQRTLASIQRITKLEPISEADNIECASVLGWRCVVKKGEFHEGDSCVYCEIDSLMPEREPFFFLKDRGFRIKTVKLRGQISQGICFPLNILNHISKIADGMLIEGMDVTDLLGIKKYEPKIPPELNGDPQGVFPAAIEKTDETRAQILMDKLKKYEGIECYITEKLDGTSVTYFYKDGEFGVCTRNLQLKRNENLTQWKLAKELNIEAQLNQWNRNIAIQGEIVGHKIQTNPYKFTDQKVFFFSAFDIDRYRYLDFEEFQCLMHNLRLPIVPIITNKYLLQCDIDHLTKLSQVKSSLADTIAEGIVIRSLEEINDTTIGRLSFKVINPEYLLQRGE